MPIIYESIYFKHHIGIKFSVMKKIKKNITPSSHHLESTYLNAILEASFD